MTTNTKLNVAREILRELHDHVEARADYFVGDPSDEGWVASKLTEAATTAAGRIEHGVSRAAAVERAKITADAAVDTILDMQAEEA